MKMINSTSTTSTSGTTLISDSVDADPPNRRPRIPPFDPLKENAISPVCLLLGIPFSQIQEFERKIFHAGADLFDAVPENVVENRRGNRGPQAQCRGEKRHGD